MMDSKKLKIGLAWINVDSGNLGVGALGYSVLALINDVCEESSIEKEMILIGSSRHTKSYVDIGDKQIHFQNSPALDFYNFKNLLKLLLKSRLYKTRELLKLDIVFDISEGDSFTDIYGIKRFRRFVNSKRFFNRLGIRQVLLPQTIGPFNIPENESKAFEAMKKMEWVISRDLQSYEYTKKFLDHNKIAQFVDVAFYMPFRKTHIDDGLIHVGLNVSGLLWNGGYTKSNQFNLKTNYKELVLQILRFFTNMEGVKVHLISHVTSATIKLEDDYLMANEIYKQFPNTIVVEPFQTPIDAKSYISAMSFFMGARMHACIAAFSSGVPVVPMAYSRKFNGLFCDTLKYEYVADCVNSTNEANFETIKSGFENRSALAGQIQQAHHQIIQPKLHALKGLLRDILMK